MVSTKKGSYHPYNNNSVFLFYIHLKTENFFLENGVNCIHFELVFIIFLKLNSKFFNTLASLFSVFLEEFYNFIGTLVK